MAARWFQIRSLIERKQPNNRKLIFFKVNITFITFSHDFFLSHMWTRFFHHREKGTRGQFRIQALEERDSSEDASYWAKYSEVLPDKTERLWDALVDGLEKYRYIPCVPSSQRNSSGTFK